MEAAAAAAEPAPRVQAPTPGVDFPHYPPQTEETTALREDSQDPEAEHLSAQALFAECIRWIDGAWRRHYCDPEAGFERVPNHLPQWCQNGKRHKKTRGMSIELAAPLRSEGWKLGHDSTALKNEKFTCAEC